MMTDPPDNFSNTDWQISRTHGQISRCSPSKQFLHHVLQCSHHDQLYWKLYYNLHNVTCSAVSLANIVFPVSICSTDWFTLFKLRLFQSIFCFWFQLTVFLVTTDFQTPVIMVWRKLESLILWKSSIKINKEISSFSFRKFLKLCLSMCVFISSSLSMCVSLSLALSLSLSLSLSVFISNEQTLFQQRQSLSLFVTESVGFTVT